MIEQAIERSSRPIGVAVCERHRRHAPVVVAARHSLRDALDGGERQQRQIHEHHVQHRRQEQDGQGTHALGLLVRGQQ